jgi:hypothetical protein
MGSFPPHRPFSAMPRPIFMREPGLPPIITSSSLTNGAHLSGPFPPNSPSSMPAWQHWQKLTLLSRPPITTSTLQCHHLCTHALEPSHHLLMPCSIMSTLFVAMLPPVAALAKMSRQELDDEASRSLSRWPS